MPGTRVAAVIRHSTLAIVAGITVGEPIRHDEVHHIARGESLRLLVKRPASCKCVKESGRSVGVLRLQRKCTWAHSSNGKLDEGPVSICGDVDTSDRNSRVMDS